MSKLLEHHRWFANYCKAYNTKQFMINLSTTHAEDICSYASHGAYITGSNQLFYFHEYFKQAVWRRIEETGFAADSTYQIPYRPSPQLRLIHLTRMVNVTAAQQTSYNQHNDPDSHPELRPGDLSVAGDLGANNVVTTPCYHSSGTVVSSVAVLALELPESWTRSG